MKTGEITVADILLRRMKQEYNFESKITDKIRKNIDLPSELFFKRFLKVYKSFHFRFLSLFSEYIRIKRLILFDVLSLYGDAEEIIENPNRLNLMTMNISIKSILEIKQKQCQEEKWDGQFYYDKVWQKIEEIIELDENDVITICKKSNLKRFDSQIDYLLYEELDYLQFLLTGVDDVQEIDNYSLSEIINWLKDKSIRPLK